MSEPKQIYASEVEDSTNNALAMLGTGYDQPSVEIEQERVVIERRGGELKEIVKPAFIKISTSFKGELIGMSDAALKVWVFISLSVNRNTGTANPGLRTIAKALGKGVNTVQECLTELEGLNLLTVDRQSRKYNIYEPTAYVSANRVDPVSSTDTDGETVSENQGTVSQKGQSVSNSQILNQSNQSKPDNDIDKRAAILMKLYSNNIASLTPIMADKLKDAALEFEDSTWYEPAFSAAVAGNARNWNYVYTVLSNWKAKGRSWKPETKGKSQQTSKVQASADALENYVKKLEMEAAQ